MVIHPTKTGWKEINKMVKNSITESRCEIASGYYQNKDLSFNYLMLLRLPDILRRIFRINYHCETLEFKSIE